MSPQNEFIMKKKLHIISAFCLLMMVAASCSDWTRPEANVYEPAGVEGSDKDEAYYANLRAWKASRTVDEKGVPNRSVSFGWFSDWTGVGVNMSNQLMGLPDSVDFVSMWGNWHGLSPEKKEDLRKVQEIKGTKVLMCFIIGNIGDQTTPQEVRTSKNVDGVQYSTEQDAVNAYWGWNEDKEAAIRKYARSILDTIKVYNWDGFDLDLEPHYGSAGNIASYPERLHMLLDEMSKELGPKSGTDKLLCVDGEPDWLLPEDGQLLDYFIIQAYYDGCDSSIDGRLEGLFRTYEGIYSREAIVGKTILCVNYESYGTSGGGSYNSRALGRTFKLNGYAAYRYPEVEAPIGGIGAFRMIFDKDYAFFREAMKTLHSGNIGTNE